MKSLLHATRSSGRVYSCHTFLQFTERCFTVSCFVNVIDRRNGPCLLLRVNSRLFNKQNTHTVGSLHTYYTHRQKHTHYTPTHAHTHYIHTNTSRDVGNTVSIVWHDEC